MKILFATAELRPLVSSGGLGEAAAGLVGGLRRAGHDVEVMLPNYGNWELEDSRSINLDVPYWARPMSVTQGIKADVGPLTLVDGPKIRRPDPYVDANGVGWPDNDLRFAAFSAAIAARADSGDYDVIHLNDWHTGLVPALMTKPKPTVLTIHNLAHQGWANLGWLHELPTGRDEYTHGDSLNMLAGAIRMSDAVVAVSPTYATEILTPEQGMDLHLELASRGEDLVGIRNGIDTASWDPTADPFLDSGYQAGDLAGKLEARSKLLARIGWPDDRLPLIVMVTRLVEQKGVDLALELAPYLPGMRARLAILGSGDKDLANQARAASEADPDHLWFFDGYDIGLSHEMFAGGDLYLMPSRFEPCGLAQMQAMAYGTIPIVTGVGGLLDTVVDATSDRRNGTGFVTHSVDAIGLVDGVHRALAAWRVGFQRRKIMERGMAIDWSWDRPAQEFVDVYSSIQP